MRCTHESEDAVYLVRCSGRVGRCFAAVVAAAVAAYGLRRTLLRFAVSLTHQRASHRMSPAHFVAFYVGLPLFVGLLVLQLALWLLG